MRPLRAACVASIPLLLACAGLPDGSALTGTKAAGVPTRFDRLSQVGGKWVVEGYCGAEPPNAGLVRDEQGRFVWQEELDADVLGTYVSGEERADGYHLHLTGPDGAPRDVDLRWGDDGHTWLGYQEQRFIPANWTGTTYPRVAPSAASCAERG